MGNKLCSACSKPDNSVFIVGQQISPEKVTFQKSYDKKKETKKKVLETEMNDEKQISGEDLESERNQGQSMELLRDRRKSLKRQHLKSVADSNSNKWRTTQVFLDDNSSQGNQLMHSRLQNLGGKHQKNKFLQILQNSTKGRSILTRNNSSKTSENNLSILSAAQALSSVQNMSSKMSTRLSIQSKKRLVALYSADKKLQYNNLYKDIIINKSRILIDQEWHQERFLNNQILQNCQNKKINSSFQIYGGNLMELQQKCLVHSYLLANLVNFVDINQITQELQTKQTFSFKNKQKTNQLNNKKDARMKIDNNKAFQPESIKEIIDFINSNSKIFRSQNYNGESNKIANFYDKNKEIEQEQQTQNKGFLQIKNIHYLYDTLNAHVFQVVDQQGLCEQFSEKNQYIIKIPRSQTKQGIFDLLFESQLNLYMQSKKFKYQFNIKEEIFEVEDLTTDPQDKCYQLLNYVVIEERQNCGSFNAQFTLNDFIKQYNSQGISSPNENNQQKQNQECLHPNEKLIYIFMQAIDMIRQLNNDFKLINYNICPLNLIITEQFELKIQDFSIVDFINPQQVDSTSTNSEQTHNDQNIHHLRHVPILLKSQFKNEIKNVQNFIQNNFGIIIEQVQNEFADQNQLIKNFLEDLNVDKDSLSKMVKEWQNQMKKTAVPQSSYGQIIKSNEDYFLISGKIVESQKFQLKIIMNCFNSLIINNQKLKKHHATLLDNQDINEIKTFMEQTQKYFIEQQYDSKDNQLDIIQNNLETFICEGMSKQQFERFVQLFSNKKISSLPELARLKMAKHIYQVSIFQNNFKLQEICLLTIGDITKNIKPLQDCLKIYENSKDKKQINSIQYSQLCIALAREYRKTSGQKNIEKSIVLLKQASSSLQVIQEENKGDQEKTIQINDLFIQFFQEQAEIFILQEKEKEAIDYNLQALQISKDQYGQISFTTIECQFNLAYTYEKCGMQDEANLMFTQCLDNFDNYQQSTIDDQLNQEQDINNYQGFNMSVKEKDASIIQKIGIYLREKKQFQKSCELLEKVLEVRKHQFIQRKQKLEAGYTSKNQEDKKEGKEQIEEEDIDQFQGKEFAKLYNDLALTYQGMDDLEYAQEYLVLAIQCLEKLQDDYKSQSIQLPAESSECEKIENDKIQGLQELADSYIFLADLLRKQANVHQATQAMLKAIEIEQDLPNRLLYLVESYKQLAEDYMILQDYEQGIQSSELALQIELQLYDKGINDENIQETILFMAEAFQFSEQPVKSNEQLSNILEIFDQGFVSNQIKIKTLKLLNQNLVQLESHEEVIKYQMKLLKILEEHDQENMDINYEEKINVYQQIANSFLQLNDHNQAIQNQMMVYNLVSSYSNEGELDQDKLKDSEATIQALFNLVQIKFMKIQLQVQEANQIGDVSVIDGEFLCETQESLNDLLQRMKIVYGKSAQMHNDYIQVEQMIQEIFSLIN